MGFRCSKSDAWSSHLLDHLGGDSSAPFSHPPPIPRGPGGGKTRDLLFFNYNKQSQRKTFLKVASGFLPRQNALSRNEWNAAEAQACLDFLIPLPHVYRALRAGGLSVNTYCTAPPPNATTHPLPRHRDCTKHQSQSVPAFERRRLRASINS